MGQAEQQNQGALTELLLLEAFGRSLLERLTLADAGIYSFNLIDVTDEEIGDQAKGLIKCLHDEKIWELNEQIANLLQS